MTMTQNIIININYSIVSLNYLLICKSISSLSLQKYSYSFLSFLFCTFLIWAFAVLTLAMRIQMSARQAEPGSSLLSPASSLHSPSNRIPSFRLHQTLCWGTTLRHMSTVICHVASAVATLFRGGNRNTIYICPWKLRQQQKSVHRTQFWHLVAAAVSPPICRG